jgi:hypothetical protein
LVKSLQWRCIDGKHYLSTLLDDNDNVRKKSKFVIHHRLHLPAGIGGAAKGYGSGAILDAPSNWVDMWRQCRQRKNLTMAMNIWAQAKATWVTRYKVCGIGMVQTRWNTKRTNTIVINIDQSA